MERFRRCEFYLDKEKVTKLVRYHFGSVTELCKKIGISRARYYEIISKPHFSKKEICLRRLEENLKVKIDEILK